jgi:hypothetical protein
MEAIYRLNSRELGTNFVNSVKDAYPDLNIEIVVREQDETEYLCGSPANREHLERAIKNVEQGKSLVSFETLEQAIQCAIVIVSCKYHYKWSQFPCLYLAADRDMFKYGFFHYCLLQQPCTAPDIIYGVRHCAPSLRLPRYL